MTFVREFAEKQSYELTNAINKYAKEEGLKIVQVSYSYNAKYAYGFRALVVFSKGE